MSDLINGRTPFVIATEINTIKYQVGKIFLQSIIEIGSRLKEARGLLQYGEWGKWLEESVSYSQKTAERMIRVFEEYGPKQLESAEAQSPTSDTQAQELPNLNFTQALILLGVPEEVRGEFIAELDMDTKKAAKIFKALSNPNRLELYFKIAEMHESSFPTDTDSVTIEIYCNFSKCSCQ